MALQLGCEFASLVSTEETHRFLADPDIWHPLKCGLVGARWGVRWLPKQYEVLAELAAAPGTVLVAAPPILAARLVQEKFGQSLASIYYTPWMIPSCIKPPAMTGGWTLPNWAPRPLGKIYWRLVDLVGSVVLGKPLNALRRRLGLPKVGRVFRWWISPELAIGLFPDWYAQPQSDWPAQLRTTSFPTFDGPTTETLPTDWIDFCQRAEPPVVFTFGTGMMHADHLFHQSIAACQRSGLRSILLTRFRHQLPDCLPPGMRHGEFVSLRQLLPYCSAIVHHGGIGTVAKALAAGTPQLIIPHAWDQQDNAARVQGIGGGQWLSRRRATPDAISHKLDQLLLPGRQQRCRSLAVRCVGADPMRQAADWILELADR